MTHNSDKSAVSRKKITLQYLEGRDDGTFWIIRLAGMGAGAVVKGDRCRLQKRGALLDGEAAVCDTFDKPITQLTDDDATLLGYTEELPLLRLKSDLDDMYRFRPQWRGDETVFRLIKIERLQQSR